MRVRFGHLSETEQAAVSALDRRVERWLSNDAARGDPSAWCRSVRRVHPGLEAEPWDGGRFVIRSDARELYPVVERVVAGARSALLIAQRPARPFRDALARVARLWNVDFSRAEARAGFTRGHLIDVTLHLPGGSEREHDAAEELVRELVGERRADDWIGAVRVAAAPRGGALRVLNPEHGEGPRLPIAELPLAIDAAIRALSAELSAEPWSAFQGERDWTLFELDPERADDWAAQDDLVMTATCVPELLKSYLSGAPFSSLRFSRHGEIFAHLKYEAAGDPEQRLRDRTALEDALDAALSAASAGRVIGGGLGLRYAYVDLALHALEPGLALITDAARRAELPTRSWLQPFDTDLAEEWAEIWPGAPAPPGIGRESSRS